MRCRRRRRRGWCATAHSLPSQTVRARIARARRRDRAASHWTIRILRTKGTRGERASALYIAIRARRTFRTRIVLCKCTFARISAVCTRWTQRALVLGTAAVTSRCARILSQSGCVVAKVPRRTERAIRLTSRAVGSARTRGVLRSVYTRAFVPSLARGARGHGTSQAVLTSVTKSRNVPRRIRAVVPSRTRGARRLRTGAVRPVSAGRFCKWIWTVFSSRTRGARRLTSLRCRASRTQLDRVTSGALVPSWTRLTISSRARRRLNS
jgi:hypothetical protein